MQTRVITIRYDEQIHGFPEDAVKAATDGRVVVRLNEHFFMHDNVPHLTLVMLLSDPRKGDVAKGIVASGSEADESAPVEDKLTDEQNAVYEALKAWRIGVAKQIDKPAYVVARNSHLKRIVKAMPKTIDELKVNAIMSDAFCEKNGEAILKVLEQYNVATESEASQMQKQEVEYSKDASLMQTAKDVALENREPEVKFAPLEDYAVRLTKRGD